MPSLTPIQSRLVEALTAAGGQAVSLYQLTTEMEIEYSNAHTRVRELEQWGLVLIGQDRTRRGCPLVIQLARQGIP